jgi:hypothetical protein
MHFIQFMNVNMHFNQYLHKLGFAIFPCYADGGSHGRRAKWNSGPGSFALPARDLALVRSRADEESRSKPAAFE